MMSQATLDDQEKEILVLRNGGPYVLILSVALGAGVQCAVDLNDCFG